MEERKQHTYFRNSLLLAPQVFVFTSTGQNIAASALGAVATSTSTWSTSYPTYANDGNADWVNSNVFSSNCVTGDAWTVTFPPLLPVYPGGFPLPVSSVVFVNRQDNAG